MTLRTVTLSCLLWLATAALAAAQPVPVRTGEHEGFTRVVLYAGPGRDWRLYQGPETIALRLDGAERFDLSRAFDRLHRRRVTGLRQEAGALVLDLGCDCGAQVYREGPDLIVMDVGRNRGRPGADGPFDAQRAPASLRLPALPDWPRTERGQVLRFPAGAGPEIPATNAATPEPSSLIPPIEVRDPTDHDVLEAQKRLLEQLGRAAAQGLLTPKGRDPVPRPAAPVDSAEEPPPPEPSPPPDPPGDQVNLRAVTSVDAGAQAIADRLSGRISGARCLPDRAVALRDWADPALGFAPQIATLRAGLTDSRDRPVPDAITALARTYLHFGFGAEADSVLDMRLEPAPEDRVLRALARIMDESRAPPGGPFDGQGGCDGDVALWAVLSTAPYPPEAPVNAPALRRAFNALPSGLRLHLGPILARRLLVAGDDDLSDAVLRITDRTRDGPDDRIDLARAELLLDRGETARARPALEAVAAADGEMTPDAMARLVDIALAESRAVAPDMADRIAALAREHRGGPLAPRLERAQTLAQASLGRFEEAFTLFDSRGPGWQAPDRAVVRDSLMRLLAANATESEFLKRALAIPEPAAGALSVETGNSVAARLLDLGFAKAASPLLATPAGRDRQILRARSALASGLPRQAEDELAGLEDEEATRLRASALAMAGSADAASLLLAELGDTEGAAAMAWQAGAWDRTAELATGAIARAAGLAQSADDPPTTAQSTPLARNRALLETSESARSTLRELLQETRLSPGETP